MIRSEETKAVFVPRVTNTKTFGGVKWECVKVGIAKYHWRMIDDPQSNVHSNYNALTYSASYHGVSLGGKFRSLEGGMRAVIKARRGQALA